MSKLRVNDVLPANGLNIGIGTAGGNLIVGGASTTVVVNGDINITGNVTGSSGATFTNITVGANNGFHVDGGAPASSLTVNNLGNTVVGSGNSVYIADGNLVFQTTGTGIDFSATSDGSGASSVSEILDDYEEGTFTPSLTFATPGTSSFSYTVQSGWYTKIGRMAHYRLELRLSAFSKGTASGDLRISGLPFTTADFGSGQFTGSFAAFNAPLPSTAGHFPFFGARLNNTEGFFKVLRNDNGWDTFPDPDANSQYKCDVTVFTI